MEGRPSIRHRLRKSWLAPGDYGCGRSECGKERKMKYIIIALTVVDGMVALLLIGAVLIQQSKDGGFSSSTFGGLGESIFGGQAADHMTKVTVALVSLFLGLTLLLAVITGRRSADTGLAETVATAVAQPPAAASKKADGDATIEPVVKKATGDVLVKKVAPPSSEKKDVPSSKAAAPAAAKDKKAKPAGKE